MNSVAPRTRLVPVVVAAGALLWAVGAQLPLRRWLGLEAPLARSPALEAEGRQVLGRKCLHCHDQIPLPPRVRGWSVERAYEALGRLPELNPAMPAFYGSDEERRALAAFLAALGDGETPR